MWEVWILAKRKRLLTASFRQRNEAEHCKQSYQRLLGDRAYVLVCFNVPEIPEVLEIPRGNYATSEAD